MKALVFLNGEMRKLDNFGRSKKRIYFVIISTILILVITTRDYFPQSEWQEKETTNFKIIYKSSHSYLADYLISCAEKSFSKLEKIFGYKPSEKIILNSFDLYDYGFGEATSIPQNYIHIEIEPFEPGYENVPYNERFQWIINHELIHIFYNDQSNKFESAARTLFSKVAPDQSNPVTIPFSVITNYNRYSPTWFQEGIATYLETWLGGGFGRVLGSFDEMFFRSMVLENKNFPTPLKLDSVLPNDSFLLEMIYYLYGARFASHLALKYGNTTFLNLYKTNNTDFNKNFAGRFNSNFGVSLNDAWNNFLLEEKEFQQKNIEKLNKAPLTKVKQLASESFGWVSQPFYDKRSNNIYYSFHAKGALAKICRFNLADNKFEELYSLPTPSLSQVSSTAFDPTAGLYFFTTNNNQLFRDLSVLDIHTNKVALLLDNERVGSLSISPATKALWGVRHNGGEASIVYSEYPYREFKTLRNFPIGEEIYNLAVSPAGRYLAVTMHKSSGEQLLLLVDLQNLDDVKIIQDSGSPDNPSWSGDEKTIYFNSYLTGVSNIFQYTLSDNKTLAVTHTLKGLFKPVEISPEKLFAFEFSSEGFIPVLFNKDKIKDLPAINYLGQQVFEKNEEVKDYLINISSNTAYSPAGEAYSGMNNIKIQAFIPVVSGFQSSLVFGFFNRIADPLLFHDFSLETGYSVYQKAGSLPKFHLKARYEYKKELIIGFQYNAPDFYDLFNERKRGMIGEKYYLGHDYYWVYDNPLKVRQKSEVALYRGVEFLNDNLVPVSQPDFMVAQTNFNSKYLRRSIGSSDFERGDEYDVNLVLFGSDIKSPKVSAQIYGQWDKLFPWIASHNILELRLSAGYRIENENHYQSKFFFGGFGNREVENVDAKQFRKVFRLPGLPMYNLACDRFVKIGFENLFPPLYFGNLALGNHYLHSLDFSVYSYSLFINDAKSSFWVDFGTQVNFVFKHWYNLESTFSAGIAKAFSRNEKGWDWFISLKLLKN